MPFKKSIFLKIFLWFWLVIVILLAVTVVLDQITTAEPRHVFLDRLSGIYTVYGGVAADYLELGEKERYLTLLGKLKKLTKTDAHLLDGSGGTLFKETEPPNEIKALARRAASSGTPQYTFDESRTLIAVPVQAKGGFVFAGQTSRLPQPLVRLWRNEAPMVSILRIFTLLGLSGLVCYFLSLYITRPVIELRFAAKRLSDGEMSARVGQKLVGRDDELAELGADFNQMADRIGSLMNLQRQLVGDISHELRSPLGRMNLAVEMLKPHAAPEGEKYLSRIEKEAEVLNGMISQLLSLSEMEGGVNMQPKVRIDLKEMLELIVSDADFEAKSSGKRVELKECAPCRTSGHQSVLHSAVENVVRNAVRHTKPGTPVTMAMRVEGDGGGGHAVITVQDGGDGVPDAELQNIFLPFYRTSGSRDHKSGGVGLGLHISERAVKIHNGTIKAENLPGSGLLVTIRLPLNGDGAAHPAKPV